MTGDYTAQAPYPGGDFQAQVRLTNRAARPSRGRSASRYADNVTGVVSTSGSTATRASPWPPWTRASSCSPAPATSGTRRDDHGEVPHGRHRGGHQPQRVLRQRPRLHLTGAERSSPSSARPRRQRDLGHRRLHAEHERGSSGAQACRAGRRAGSRVWRSVPPPTTDSRWVTSTSVAQQRGPARPQVVRVVEHVAQPNRGPRCASSAGTRVVDDGRSPAPPDPPASTVTRPSCVPRPAGTPPRPGPGATPRCLRISARAASDTRSPYGRWSRTVTSSPPQRRPAR